MSVQLVTGIPVANGIIPYPPTNDEQAGGAHAGEGRGLRARGGGDGQSIEGQSMKNSRRRGARVYPAGALSMAGQRVRRDLAAGAVQGAEGLRQGDQALVETLLRGVTGERTRCATASRRTWTAHKGLSPVEHALLLLAACELRDHLQTPYKVVINEAIELPRASAGRTGTSTSMPCSTSSPPNFAGEVRKGPISPQRHRDTEKKLKYQRGRRPKSSILVRFRVVLVLSCRFRFCSSLCLCR